MTVSPNPRRVHNRTRYDALSDVRQKEVIMKALNKALDWCKYPGQSTVHFEYNKRLMLHCHFAIQLPLRKVKAFQVYVSGQLGSDRLSPDICVNMCPELQWVPKKNPVTGVPYESWEEYCNKENVLNPVELKCKCIKCLVETDKRVIKKQDTGEIVLTFPD